MATHRDSTADSTAPAAWACELCGSARSEPFAEEAGFTLLRCAECRVIAVAPKPDPATLAAWYARRIEERGAHDYWADYFAKESSFRSQSAYILSLLEPHARAPGRLLDVGCGAGFFLDEARRTGWDVCGVDLAEPFVRFARERLSLDVRLGDLAEQQFSADSFDAVVMLDVLSHLPSPRRTMETVATVLRPRGILFLQAGNKAEAAQKPAGEDWETPLHLFHFTRPAIRRLLEGAGFEVERMVFAPHLRVPAAGRRLLGRLPFVHTLYRWARRLRGSLASKDAAPDGTVYVVARKRGATHRS